MQQSLVKLVFGDSFSKTEHVSSIKISPGVIVDKILPKKQWFPEMFQLIPH